MSENQSSYRQIMKATSLFGGVQVFTIMISIIRSKVISVLLGPAGMGIVGLLNSSLSLISGFTSLGLETSAIKSISIANKEENLVKVAKQVTILNRLMWFSGILGALLIMILSSWLSKLTFDNSDYTFAFIWVSITLLFKQLTNGQLAVLQALQKLQYLAKANLYGNFLGLIITIPLYYYWKIDAIVATIIISSLMGFIFSWYFFNKIKIVPIKLTAIQTVLEGKEMLKLGLSLSFISLLNILSAYALQIVISNHGGVLMVGLFNAGFAIINSYVGLIFNAMSTDYFPRLSAISDDNKKVRITVIQQAIVAILIITPIIILFLTFTPVIIRILYSDEFSDIIPMVSFGILGMLFKAVSWSLGYILIAKGDSRMFIKTSLFFNSIFLLNNILGYYFYGLEGLGGSFILNYMIHFFALKMITNKRYEFYFDKEFYRIFLSCLFLCIITFLFSYISFFYLRYSLMICTIILSLVYTLYHLNKKMDLKELFKEKIKR